MVNVTLRMPLEMRDAADQIAEAFQGLDRSDIVRAAIRLFLQVYPEKGPALLMEPVRPRAQARPSHLLNEEPTPSPSALRATLAVPPQDDDGSAIKAAALKAEREAKEAKERAALIRREAEGRPRKGRKP